MTETRIAAQAGEARLLAFLETSNTEAFILTPGVAMPTVPLAAAAIGVRDEQIIKSVLFKDRTGAVALAVASGTARIDRHRLSETVGLPGLKLADAATVLAATGYPAGGVCPIGHATAFPVVVDSRVMHLETVFGGAGSEESLLQIAPADIVRLTGATIADITQSAPD